MVRVHFHAHLTAQHHSEMIAAHKRGAHAVYGAGFGSWLRHAAHSVGHFVTHNPISQDIIKAGAGALGDIIGGPGGGKIASSLAGSLLPGSSGSEQSGLVGAAQSAGRPDPQTRAATPGAPPAPRPPPPPAAPAAAAAAAAAFGVRRKRKTPKKRAPAKRKAVHRRPY